MHVPLNFSDFSTHSDGLVNSHCGDLSHAAVSWIISKASIPFVPAWVHDDDIITSLAVVQHRPGPDFHGIGQAIQVVDLLLVLRDNFEATVYGLKTVAACFRFFF